jgi:membrane protease subunit (stomatin/prohibitin family)
MAIIDRVKWDGVSSLIAWKFPHEELSTWTQLIVNETQEAFLVRGGVYEGPFGAGRHTLSTENIPVLRALMGIPFGGKTPFSAEVWYVNRTINLDVKWGTPSPIQLQDPAYQIMVPVRAYGQYGIRVINSKKFLLKLVGTLPAFDVNSLEAYFRGVFTSKIKTEVARVILKEKIPVLQIASELDAISRHLKNILEGELTEYGIGLQQFSIGSINVPEDDPAVISLKMALAKKAEMGILGFNYQQERSFDVLQAAASNEGVAGGVMGAGLGMGLGVGIGGPIGNYMGGISQHLQPATAPAPASADFVGIDSYEKKIEVLSKLSKLRDQGILSSDEFEREKQKVLGS